ncbi:MAG: FAD-dependent oxidoreductase [Myxococcales bacterium]|nr:FAD-dependent oxidoreductase [Myxococcales bacterium]
MIGLGVVVGLWLLRWATLPRGERGLLGLRGPLARLIRRRLGGYEQLLEPPKQTGRVALEDGETKTVLVVGAGLAGLGAACELAERGFAVTLVDKNDYLGGKVGAWHEQAADGTPLEVEHGFHAFFRHYYNLGRFLDRTGVKPHLEAIDDYLILEKNGRRWSFRDVETSPVLNLLALASAGLYRFRDILLTPAVHEMDVFLAYDRAQTFAELDGESYEAFARRTQLPASLRLVFNTFARAFFADADRLSMAELVKSFHFYYLSHDHGLIYDYPAEDYQTSVLGPIRAYLEERGVQIELGRTVDALVPREQGIEVDGESYDHVVLATTAAGARALAESSPALARRAPELVEALRDLRAGQRYSVLRLWLDRDLGEGLPVFVSTERQPVLDAVTFYHRITTSGRRFAEETGGSVVELHCYAVPDEIDEAELRAAFWRELCHYFPEVEGARVIHEVMQVRDDFTAFHVGQMARRPETRTTVGGLTLAGDWVKLPCPAMLMEAACTSGLLAANTILEAEGLDAIPIYTVPQQGLLYELRQKKLAALAGRPQPAAAEG